MQITSQNDDNSTLKCKNLIVVLGMHRSGTSVLTNILSKAGFFVGDKEDLIQPNKYNKDGFFERWSVLKLNEQILEQCGGFCFEPPDEDKINSVNIDSSIREILSVYNGHNHAIIKDPRLCLTFPVWKSSLGPNIKIIRISRNPEAVASSMVKRNKFSTETALQLNQIYNERADKYSEGYPLFKMQYEDLFSKERQKILDKLADFLKINISLETIANNIIDPAQYHHKPASSNMSKKNIDPIYNNATQLLKQGKNDEAFEILEKALNPFTDHALAHNDLGVLYFQKGLSEKAITHIKHALSLEPDNPIFIRNLKDLSASIIKSEIQNSAVTTQNSEALSLITQNSRLKTQNSKFSSLPSSLNTKSWWDYPRFKNSTVKVLLISLRHLLLSEINGSLQRMGHECRIFLIEGEELDKDTVEKMFMNAIREFKPDFVLTINHLGFDREGVVTDLMTRGRIPFASWYVDSPQLIIEHYANNKSPYLSLFLWDLDYIDIVKKLGFENAHYLPLGVDETLFKPIPLADNPLKHLSTDISFVGNSMQIKVNSILNRFNISGPLLKNFNEVASAFEYAEHLIVRDLLKDKFPELYHHFLTLQEPAAFGYEAGVIWAATGSYRLNLVKKLAPYNPLIIGDPGWKDILGDDFRLHKELNYYQDLTNFYNVSKITFNATSRQMKTGINQRVFDMPACRGVVLTDWTKQLENLMEPGKELLAYKHADEIHELVEQTLNDNLFYSSICRHGHNRVLNEHTYCHRLKQLIQVMVDSFKQF
ncbi:MAG: glycosyltransferase [Desulfobacterales bacterium]|nr:glycosyltransferase [Desulfobacterales bacterium]